MRCSHCGRNWELLHKHLDLGSGLVIRPTPPGYRQISVCSWCHGVSIWNGREYSPATENDISGRSDEGRAQIARAMRGELDHLLELEPAP